MTSGPFRGPRRLENHGSGLILTRAPLQRSRSKLGGSGPNSRDSPGLEVQGPGAGARGPGFTHPGSTRTHRLGQQEAAFERAEESARGQQGSEPWHCPATSGALRGLRIRLWLCVRGPHSGAIWSSLGLTASPTALEGSGNPLCGRRKSGVSLGRGLILHCPAHLPHPHPQLLLEPCPAHPPSDHSLLSPRVPWTLPYPSVPWILPSPPPPLSLCLRPAHILLHPSKHSSLPLRPSPVCLSPLLPLPLH